MTTLKDLHKRLRFQNMKLLKSIFVRRGRMDSADPQSSLHQGQPCANLYTGCYDLPLVNFINCLVDHDFRWLMRDEVGEYNEEQAKRNWDSIYLEYLELIGNDDLGYLIKISLEIQSLQSLIIATECAINSLYKNKDEKLIKILLEVGYKVELMAGWDAYFQSLENIRIRLGALNLEHKRKLAEFENLKALNRHGKISMDYFEDTLIILTKYMGVHLRKTDLTTSEFARMLRKYNKEAEKWHKAEK